MHLDYLQAMFIDFYLVKKQQKTSSVKAKEVFLIFILSKPTLIAESRPCVRR